MKIALVLSVPPGYSETFFNSKIKGLQENGHEIILFTGPSQETYKACIHKKNPQVHKYFLVQLFQMCLVGFQLLSHINAVWRFYKLERNEGRTLKRILENIYVNAQLLKFKGHWIHYGFATLAINRELLAKALGVKMAVSFRGFDINVYPLKQPHCYNLLWKQIDKVHAISSYILEKAHVLGLPKTVPYQIINPAVNLYSLPKRTFQDSKSTLNIITIARLNWIKGIDYLIEVVACLKLAHIDFEWQLIGSGNTFELERYMYHLHEKGLEHHVVLKGKCSHNETLKMLAAADVYVQTSLNEGFCNAVLEAQALGIPCIAFGVGGLPENISDTKTGWLIEPYKVEAMAKKIIAVSNLSTLAKERLSEQAIKRVEIEFSLEKQKQDFLEFYSN